MFNMKICPNCGKEFKGKRGDARFCSRSCQNHYNYKHKTDLKGLGNLPNLKIVKEENADQVFLNEQIEPEIEPQTEKTVQTLPPYKTPTIDSDSIKEALGLTDFEEDPEGEYEEQEQDEEETQSESQNTTLPEKFITKQVQTNNPLYTSKEKHLNENTQLKQKLEQEYAKLEAELKFQEGRTGNDIVALGAIGGGILGWASTPIKDTVKKDPEKKDDVVLKDKDGKPILRSIKNKWKKIKSKKKQQNKITFENKEPSFSEKLGRLLLFGALGTTAGLITKVVTEDSREKDKKEKIEGIKKRMNEIRKDYAFVTQSISNAQKQLGQIPRHILGNKTEINPEYFKALNGLNQKTEQDMNKTKHINKKSSEPARFKSDKVIPATELAKQKFSAFGFKGVWKEFFGLPSTNFHILIHGNSGEGKSTFCLWFAKYLAENFGVVLYVSGEEGTNKTFYDKLQYTAANVKDLHILDVRTGDEFMDEINENEAHFIFLDSLHDMDIDAEKLKQIFQKYKKSAFICIDQNNKKGDLLGANEKKHICDTVVNVRNYTAETTKNRFKAKGMVFKTEDFPGSEKRNNSSFKSKKQDDPNDKGYNLDSDRRGIV